MEHLIGGDAKFRAWNIRYRGPSTGCNQDIGRADLRAVRQADQVRPGNYRTLAENLHLRIAQCLAVQPFEPIDFGRNIVAQRWPVKGRTGGIPTKTLRIGQVFGKVRTINEQLLGNTATNDAGAANAILLCDCYPCAVRRSNARGTHAA